MRYSSEWPIFWGEYGESITEESAEEFHNFWSAYYKQNTKPFGWVTLIESIGTPRIRKNAADHIAEIDSHFREYCVRQAFVVPNSLYRGALTATFWLQRPGWNWKTFTDKDAAFEWVREAFPDSNPSRPDWTL